jgi:hypothetical protein
LILSPVPKVVMKYFHFTSSQHTYLRPIWMLSCPVFIGTPSERFKIRFLIKILYAFLVSSILATYSAHRNPANQCSSLCSCLKLVIV